MIWRHLLLMQWKLTWTRTPTPLLQNQMNECLAGFSQTWWDTEESLAGMHLLPDWSFRNFLHYICVVCPKPHLTLLILMRSDQFWPIIKPKKLWQMFYCIPRSSLPSSRLSRLELIRLSHRLSERPQRDMLDTSDDKQEIFLEPKLFSAIFCIIMHPNLSNSYECFKCTPKVHGESGSG